MNAEQFFNQKTILDLSFFNFRNAITAAYFANRDLQIQRVNENFRKFFPILGNVTNASMPDVLEQLGVSGDQIDLYRDELNTKGSVLLPKVEISVDGATRIFSLLSAHTSDKDFSYLNGVQGQFVDRTVEWELRRQHDALLSQKVKDRELIEEKSRQLESLANRLAKYLSPQIYSSIFSETEDSSHTHKRKNLTVFFSDIVQFTDLSDTLEPERLAVVINSYLSEMTNVALEFGGTIDKFIGDAVLVFFGDPESQGDFEDALRCVEMALRMQERITALQGYWKKNGVPNGLRVRMGVATGYCTVGNFGSDQRLDYTVLGRPVNLAARLQELAEPGKILTDQNTLSLINKHVRSELKGAFIPKGFAREVSYFEISDLAETTTRKRERELSHVGERVEVNVLDSSDIRAAIEELAEIQKRFEKQLINSTNEK
ncbi:adenylate/guanylate cyclase domain-containing protein [Sulfitobacter aestuariivivens]|uniref:Adenylate/guanylate cyclase domain-containing protein n=1 Tax=Sulfitobacter aestuariivivens TaxID=2766981 RepID=A0A927D1P8_9RHOB|nr:adenylate/guanylate cyclase domain-containing protein [Sulfitobacter aestuariivivens]MBD3662728.1 adenylate/guanylate cyclase domain-containing protein [Sulfitobacter aestuariivivens]